MNIFAVHKNPVRAAQCLSDKHVIKMILESAQMLCTSIHLHGGSAPYRVAHKNHPCTIWTRSSRSNFMWLCEHALELCRIYTDNFDRVHSSEKVINECLRKAYLIPDGPLTAFAQAMPDEFKNDCAIQAYRSYYTKAKQSINKWTYQSRPSWVAIKLDEGLGGSRDL